MNRDERLALADKIKYAIDTESKITLYALHGRMVEAALRQSSERDAVVEGVQLIDGDEEDFTVGVERITLPRPKPLASKAGSEANSPPKSALEVHPTELMGERLNVAHDILGSVLGYLEGDSPNAKEGLIVEIRAALSREEQA